MVSSRIKASLIPLLLEASEPAASSAISNQTTNSGFGRAPFAVDIVIDRLLRLATNAPRKINVPKLPMPAWK